MSKESILQVIYKELENINENNISLTADTDMTTDLNVDSVSVMDLMFALEEEFDVAVPLNDLADIRTIGELANLVEKLSNQ